MRRLAHGQGLGEYALVIATIAVLILLGGVTLGERLRVWFQEIAQRVTLTRYE